MTPISLEMYSKLTNCGTGYVEIRCVVDGNLIANLFSIALMRQEKSVVSYDDESKETKVTELTNRSGVSVQSISNISISYLSMKINGSVVEPTKDEGPYKCIVDGLDANGRLIAKNTSLKMMNSTGNFLRLHCMSGHT